MPLPADLLALLNACRADPASDLPRLVLADWLDEHDDPARAEFLRVQCELVRPTLDTERTATLKLRERALIDANWRAWAGGLNEMCCDLIDYEAFINQAVARDQWRQRTQQAPPVPTVARDNPFLAALPWAFSRGLLRVNVTTQTVFAHELRPWARSDEAEWLECFRLLINQRRLYDLSRSIWTPRQIHRFVRLELTISTREANSTLVAETAAANYGQVTRLRLEGEDCSAVAEALMRKKFIRLVSLDVGGTNLPPETLLALAKRTPRLNVLSAWRTPLGDQGFAALLGTSWGETLHTLEVMNCDLGDDAMTSLVESGLLSRLYGPQLNLSMNRIGDAGLAALAESEYLLRFGELVLRENRVGDDGVEALAASPFAANLRYLDLWKNRLTDRGAAALAASPHLGRLRDLNARDNALTEVGRGVLTQRYGAAAKVGF